MAYFLDIESLSAQQDATVLSVGMIYVKDLAAQSYSDLGKNSLYVKMDARYQISQLKRHVDSDTLSWWKRQVEVVRNAAIKPSDNDCSPEQLFQLIHEFVRSNSGNSSTRCYTRGSMDVNVLEHLAKQCNTKLPFRYNDYRDVRTAIDLLYPNSVDGYVDVDDLMCYNFNVGDVIKHHPVHDCMYDAAMMLFGKN